MREVERRMGEVMFRVDNGFNISDRFKLDLVDWIWRGGRKGGWVD